MSDPHLPISREFRGLFENRDVVAILSGRVGMSPERVWHRLSSTAVAARIPIGDGEGVGSAFVSDMATGQVTACDPPRAFRLALTYRASRADCTFSLFPVTDGRASFRIESRFRAYPTAWRDALREAVAAMLQWELLLVERLRDEETTARASDALLAERMQSEVGRRDLVRAVEAWWRATIPAGLDDDHAAFESNHLTRQILELDDMHPHVETLREIRTQGAVRRYVESTTSQVREERDRCRGRLLAQVGEILNGARTSRGKAPVSIDWVVDERRYLPFRWIVQRSSVTRFLGSPDVPYRVVEVIEYQIARGRLTSGTLDAVADAPNEIEIPIRQTGRVMRDEGAGLDRAHMSWSIPRVQVEIVELDPTLSSVEIIQRATDETAKVVVSSHLGLDETLYECEVHPEAIREYVISSPAT